jgi:hypothetical protein
MFSEIKREPRLIEKDLESKVSQNEWDTHEDPFNKSNKKYVKNKPKNSVHPVNNEKNQKKKPHQNFETPISDKTERSNTSLASDLTKNSRSDNIDGTNRK